MTKKLTFSFPQMFERTKSLPENVYTFLRNLIERIKEGNKRVAIVVNHNAVDMVSQAAQPTPEEGRIYFWVDSDAAAGQPKAYIVVRYSSTSYTFASEETV